jgi:hypothetical protein
LASFGSSLVQVYSTDVRPQAPLDPRNCCEPVHAIQRLILLSWWLPSSFEVPILLSTFFTSAASWRRSVRRQHAYHIPGGRVLARSGLVFYHSCPNLETGDNDPLWVLRSSVCVTLRILRDYMVCWLSLEVKAGKLSWWLLLLKEHDRP